MITGVPGRGVESSLGPRREGEAGRDEGPGSPRLDLMSMILLTGVPQGKEGTHLHWQRCALACCLQEAHTTACDVTQRGFGLPFFEA